MTPGLTWARVRAWRVARQRLDRRVPKRRLLDVVRDVCGLHAQVQSSAELQAWARVEGVTAEDVRDALWERRTLVRSWAMRGTLHVLTADDLPVYVGALRTHDRWWKGAWLRMIGFSEPELRSILEAIHRSLGARPITRERLTEKVAALVGPRGRERMGSGWGEMLKPAAFAGSLVSGPPRGQNVTFVRPDRWLKAWAVPEPDEAWREVVRRYLRTYGPATRDEFARWWGMQPATAGRILKASADELEEIEVEGEAAWALAGEAAAMRKARLRSPARLLPAFDVYVAGSRPKASLVDRRFEARVFRQAGWITPVVLVDGMVAGVWGLERRGAEFEVAVEPFGTLSAARRREVAEEADRLGDFLGAPARVTWIRP